MRPRSGLAYNYGITVLNTPGTIDSDYRGELFVLLYNTSPTDFEVRHGDRIAQLVICPIVRVHLVEVSDLDATPRGDRGYGSTGVK